MKGDLDVFRVEPRHEAVHAALVNWANWARVRPIYTCSPMFRLARSGSRQWHQPQIHDTVDLIAAMKVEKVIAKLPPLHADVLRWWYVFQWPANAFCRSRGFSRSTLLRICTDARTMVENIMGIHVQSLPS